MIDPFQHYDQAYADFRWDVPQHLNMAQSCDLWCERDPDKTAIIDATDLENVKHFTYADLSRAADTLAHHLKGLGIVSGDRIGGCAVRTLDRRRAYRDLEIGGHFDPAVQTVRARSLVITPIRCRREMRDCGSRGAFGVDRTERDAGPARGTDVIRSTIYCAKTSAETPAVLIYTSGTTGKSKGALHAHRVLMGHLPGVEVSHDFLGQNGDVIWTLRIGPDRRVV